MVMVIMKYQKDQLLLESWGFIRKLPINLKFIIFAYAGRNDHLHIFKRQAGKYPHEFKREDTYIFNILFMFINYKFS